jgi:dTMP kinase
MTERGRFITIEGGEGTGKSTLVSGLRASADFADALFTREPGGSPGAEEIRALLVTGEPDRWDALTELLLLNAARRDHVRCTIEPALAAGRTVICDRYLDSTRAYQGARGVETALIDQLHERIIGLSPDTTLLLDAPAEIGLGRAATRAGPDRFERMGSALHETLRQSFLAQSIAEPDRFTVIDATQTPEAILAAALAAL